MDSKSKSKSNGIELARVELREGFFLGTSTERILVSPYGVECGYGELPTRHVQSITLIGGLAHVVLQKDGKEYVALLPVAAMRGMNAS
jgi:hypothetical protein